MGKVIVVTSGKGGTGKTTTTAALASALAQRNYRALCIDTDIGLKNLDISLGLTDMALPDFYDVLEGRIPLQKAVLAHPSVPWLYFLSAPSLITVSDIDSEKMKTLVSEARRAYDVCIIDSPAGIGGGFQLASKYADAAIIVTTGDLSSCRDTQRVVMELRGMGISDIMLIINRIRPRIFKKSGQNVDDIVDAVGARLIGIVPEDRNVILAANQGVPLIKYSSRGAAAAYTRIAGRLLGERISAGDMKPIL